VSGNAGDRGSHPSEDFTYAIRKQNHRFIPQSNVLVQQNILIQILCILSIEKPALKKHKNLLSLKRDPPPYSIVK
jgi:hypothetical protein